MRRRILYDKKRRLEQDNRLKKKWVPRMEIRICRAQRWE